MASYELKGTVTEVFDTQTIGIKGFKKREFRVREDKEGEWANIVSFLLKKDKCELADSLSEGAKVNVHFNVNGRIWDKGDGSPTRCFVDLDCWKIDLLSKGKQKPLPPPAEPDDDDMSGDPLDVPF